MDTILSSRNLEKQYISSYGTACHAVNDVSLDIARGSIVCIVGPSGAGKSTLLHLLAGLDAPTNGAVLLDGKPLPFDNESLMARIRNKRFGCIFQFHHLLPEFTVYENVCMPLRIYADCATQRSIEQRCDALLATVGLWERRTHFPQELSGGEQQRVAVVRALVNQPDIIFADEPTGNLDHANRIAIYELLEGIVRETRTTLVIVTHDEAVPFHDAQKITLVDGKIEVGK